MAKKQSAKVIAQQKKMKDASEAWWKLSDSERKKKTWKSFCNSYLNK